MQWKLVNHCCWETIQLKLSVLKTSNYFQVPLWIDQYYLHMENQLALCLHSLQPLSQFGFFKNDTFKFVIMELFLSSDVLTVVFNKINTIENRIYSEELKESLGMNFFSPFQPEREFKVYKSCKCSQIICSRVH